MDHSAAPTRPLELDALRLLVVVHRLGTPIEDGVTDEPADGTVRVLRGEDTAQTLDHLVAHPATLAYLLMDVFRGDPSLAEQRGALARRCRWLLANDRRRYQPSRRRGGWQTPVQVDARRLHRFDEPTWRRWDDIVALLAVRDLLRVAARARAGSAPRLDYRLTAAAETLLDERVYSVHRDSAFHAQVCALIEDLPAETTGTLRKRLRRVGTRLDAFRRDESLPLDDDLAPRLFYATFRERL